MIARPLPLPTQGRAGQTLNFLVGPIGPEPTNAGRSWHANVNLPAVGDAHQTPNFSSASI